MNRCASEAKVAAMLNIAMHEMNKHRRVVIELVKRPDRVAATKRTARPA